MPLQHVTVPRHLACCVVIGGCPVAVLHCHNFCDSMTWSNFFCGNCVQFSRLETTPGLGTLTIFLRILCIVCTGQQAGDDTRLEDSGKPASHQRPHHQLPAFSHPAHLPGAAAQPAGLHESCAGYDQPQSGGLWCPAQVLHLSGVDYSEMLRLCLEVCHISCIVSISQMASVSLPSVSCTCLTSFRHGPLYTLYGRLTLSQESLSLLYIFAGSKDMV